MAAQPAGGVGGQQQFGEQGRGKRSSAPTAMAVVNAFRTGNLPWIEVFMVQHPRKILGITEPLRLGKATEIISPIHQPIPPPALYHVMHHQQSSVWVYWHLDGKVTRSLGEKWPESQPCLSSLGSEWGLYWQWKTNAPEFRHFL